MDSISGCAGTPPLCRPSRIAQDFKKNGSNPALREGYRLVLPQQGIPVDHAPQREALRVKTFFLP
jgi:hypothetical protein